MLKGKSNLVFIGFMGSGKSMVAQTLGRKLGKRVLSTDDLISEQEGQSIADIFETFGETFFRKLEEQTVEKIASSKDVIIDCGGGIILNQKNIDRLKENGCLVYLSAGAEFLYKMVKDQKHRPLMNVEDPLEKIRALLAQRKSKYDQADVTVISEGKSIDEICNEILELIKND